MGADLVALELPTSTVNHCVLSILIATLSQPTLGDEPDYEEVINAAKDALK